MFWADISPCHKILRLTFSFLSARNKPLQGSLGNLDLPSFGALKMEVQHDPRRPDPLIFDFFREMFSASKATFAHKIKS